MMHSNTCFILMCDLDRQREILCCLDCIIIPYRRIHLREAHVETGTLSTCEYERMKSHYFLKML